MRTGSASCCAIAGAVLIGASVASAGDETVTLQTTEPICAVEATNRYADCRNESMTAPAVCNLVDTVVLPDPAGDATPGSPLYVDILAVNLHYLANRLQIEWVSADSSFGGLDDLVADQQYLRVEFDLDRDDSTGDDRSIPGVELSVSVSPENPGFVDLNYFDEQGNWLPQELVFLPVVFTGDGFVVEIDVDAHMFGFRHFDVGAHTFGLNPWNDAIAPQEVVLDETDASLEVRLRADQMVLESKPPLAAIPTATSDLQLSSELLYNGSPVPVNPSLVSYEVFHSRPDYVPDPSSIISVTPDGLAQYESDGFVFVRSRVDCGQFRLTSEPIILATGTVYGNPREESVIAVFRNDFTPDGSTYSFGDMMTGHPEMMRVLDLAYEMSCDVYGGYLPLHGDRQILSPIVAEGLCGGPGNPMQTAPCCYMNCGEASPNYVVIVHEMGHNFQELGGIAQLLWDNDGRISSSGFGECSASLPVIYLQHEIVENGSAYGIEPGSFVHTRFLEDRDYYCPTSQGALQDFEEQIIAGTLSGIFDPNVPDGVAVHCAFFEQFTCGYAEEPNPYRHEVVRRFLRVLGDRRLPGYVPEKAETYFGAVYSLAVGSDMRDKLRFWGFDIDDSHYGEIMPLVVLRLEQAERRILHESFETGELGNWTVYGGSDVLVSGGQAAYGGLYGGEISVAPCATLEELALTDRTVSGVESFQACQRITAGQGFVVAPGGEAALMAGDSITLLDDLEVEAGGKLTVEIEPAISPFAHLEDDSPISETSYNVEFFVNLDDLTIGVGDEIEHFVGYGAGRVPRLKLVLHSGPQMTLSARDSGGAWHSSSAIGMGPGWNKVSIAWEASDQASPSLTLNDGSPTALSIIDTTGLTVEGARWGAVSGTIGSTSGVMRLDEFASWR